jgi:hypothetical protein
LKAQSGSWFSVNCGLGRSENCSGAGHRPETGRDHERKADMTILNAHDTGAAANGPTADPLDRALSGLSAVTLAASGYIHAQLYSDGYRYIHVVGLLFLLQAAASFALAVLLLAGTVLRAPALIRFAAAATAFGALAGFAASRTIGVFGFTERGLQPAPQALISVLVEIAALALLATAAVRALRRR